MTTPKKGDRVKVEYEGVITGTSFPHTYVQTDDGESYSPSVRHVTVIEPEYEGGKVYIDAHGALYYRIQYPDEIARPWRHVRSGKTTFESTPARKLRKLVPEGSA